MSASSLPVISGKDRLAGIVTASDVSKVVAMKYSQLEEIIFNEYPAACRGVRRRQFEL